MKEANSRNRFPRAKVYGSIVKKYYPLQNVDRTKIYDLKELTHFKLGLLFGIVHLN